MYVSCFRSAHDWNPGFHEDDDSVTCLEKGTVELVNRAVCSPITATWAEETTVQDRLPGGITPLELEDPSEVGGLPLLGRVGAGGMGTVYLADAPDGRRVAIKVI